MMATAPAPLTYMLPPHGAALVVWAVLTTVICFIGIKVRDTPRGTRFDNHIGILLALGFITVNAWWLSPGNLQWGKSLPLHLCDLAALCAPLALMTQWRLPRTLLYFWGLGLSTQGFVTPATVHGPEHGEFWMHWVNHGAVVGGAMYDLFVRRFRPTWRDLRITIYVSIAYLVVIFSLDLITGWNYAFVGNTTPENETIVDFLGPWPLRVVWISFIATSAMVALMLPWVIARRMMIRKTQK